MVYCILGNLIGIGWENNEQTKWPWNLARNKRAVTYRNPNKLEVLKSCKAMVLTNDFERNILYKFAVADGVLVKLACETHIHVRFFGERSDDRKYVCVSQAMVKWSLNMVVFRKRPFFRKRLLMRMSLFWSRFLFLGYLLGTYM